MATEMSFEFGGTITFMLDIIYALRVELTFCALCMIPWSIQKILTDRRTSQVASSKVAPVVHYQTGQKISNKIPNSDNKFPPQHPQNQQRLQSNHQNQNVQNAPNRSDEGLGYNNSVPTRRESGLMKWNNARKATKTFVGSTDVHRGATTKNGSTDVSNAGATPTTKDYLNVLRLAAVQNNCNAALKVLEEMRQNNVTIDNIVCNMVLAVCISAGKLSLAQSTLESLEEHVDITDVITYNTLMKGYAKAGDMATCYKLFKRLKSKNVAPSQVTYGILLDGYICDDQPDMAAEIFEMMTRENCPMNTVLYTTLIKGFARSNQLHHALQVFKRMQSDSRIQPDLVTYSVLIRAYCENGGLENALRLLDEMISMNLQPDEVIFNNLLIGCANEMNSILADRLYQDMVASGVKPSNATFSILIRVYSQTKLLDVASEMLHNEPDKHGVELEARLYIQFIHCCLRDRQGRRAIEVYNFMCTKVRPTPSMHSNMLWISARLNMFDTAADILISIQRNGGQVEPKEVAAIHEAALKKRKIDSARAIGQAMASMGLCTKDQMPSKSLHKSVSN